MYHSVVNPGGSGVYGNIFFGDNTPSAIIKIISLDKYFAENKINPKDIKYIWIDTEGFEPQVLIGMKNILTENPAPIFFEFNPHLYKKSGYFDKMLEFLSGFYSHYVWVQQTLRDKKIEVQLIESLRNFKDVPGLLGDIFLIHELKEVAE